MRTVYREKRYYCGEYLDVYIYPTYAQARSRGKRSKPTSAAQKKLNQRHREEKLVRLLHANFTPDDLEMDESDARILRLWYIERKSKDEIAEAVCYASPTSIYDQRNKALVRFALLYFGAGAMPSM